MEQRSSMHDIDDSLIKTYFGIFQGDNANLFDYKNLFHVFKRQAIQQEFDNGVNKDRLVHLNAQLDDLENLRQAFFNVSSNFGLVTRRPQVENKLSATPSNKLQVAKMPLPMSDQHILVNLINSMAKEESVLDMPDTIPLTHWRNDMSMVDFEKIAQRFLVSYSSITLFE
jgi:hypothetical protein